MAEYFVDPYTKYYDCLESASSMGDQLASVGDEVKTISDNIGKLQSEISLARWKELGQIEISTTILPTMAERINSISSDITDVLSQVIAMAAALYESAKQLKEEDEKYEKAKEELETLKTSEPPQDTGTSTDHADWQLKYDAKQKEVDELIKKCEELQKSMDEAVEQINGLEISDEPDEIVREITAEELGGINIDIKNAGDGMVSMTYNGVEYLVTDTAIGINDYLKIIQNNGIAQRFSKKYDDKCMGFAAVHTGDLYKGRTTSTGEDGYSYHSAIGLNWDKSEDQTWDKSEAISKMVEEISNGRPVVVQVNGSQRENGSWGRHFVTAVGIKQDAINSGTITEDDFIVIDSYDGQLKTLGTSGQGHRFMTRGVDTGNGDYGYYVLPISVNSRNKTQEA